jgi:hypothetical protein
MQNINAIRPPEARFPSNMGKKYKEITLPIWQNRATSTGKFFANDRTKIMLFW